MEPKTSQATRGALIRHSISGGAAAGGEPGSSLLRRSYPSPRAIYRFEWTAVALLLAASLFAGIYELLRPQPIHIAGLTIDRLSTALTLLVAAIGAVNFNFSWRYLDGDLRRGPFMSWLLFTLTCAYVLMLSTNLLLLAAAWSLTSIGLHKLLTHYPERVEAVRAARKKFLISRVGDLALLGLIVCVWWNWHTFDLNEVFARMDAAGKGALAAAAVLIVLAAITKSAQVPFHSWLPETMESPTPVSALMHAGIINAGGALLLRTAPLLVRVPAALLLLSVVGTATAVMGALCMWTQVKVKRTLAWSTVSQMGFMTAECGLGAFPAALLHIVAHGCYKAWSFLRSGDLPSESTARAPQDVVRTLVCVAVGASAAIVAMPVASRLSGFAPLHSAGETALAGVLALSIGQLWASLLGKARTDQRPGVIYRVALSAALTVVATTAAFGLYRVAAWYLMPVLGSLLQHDSATSRLAAALPVAGLLALTIIHALLPALASKPFGFALRVHALHGFYLGAIADRVVEMIWKTFSKRSDRGWA